MDNIGDIERTFLESCRSCNGGGVGTGMYQQERKALVSDTELWIPLKK